MDQWENDCFKRHISLHEGLQVWLRTIGVLSVFGGFMLGVVLASHLAPYAWQAPVAYSIILGMTGASIVVCTMLWVWAAILDALRVMAANSFMGPTPATDPSERTA